MRRVALVIEAQSPGDAGKEGIVVLGSRGVRGAQDPIQREREDVVMPRHLALGHHR